MGTTPSSAKCFKELLLIACLCVIVLNHFFFSITLFRNWLVCYSPMMVTTYFTTTHTEINFVILVLSVHIQPLP